MRRLLIIVAVLLGAIAAGVAAVLMTVPAVGATVPPVRTASVAPVQRVPPPYVFWFTQAPKGLEAFECVVVPQFSRLFQGLQVRVCVPYFLNGYPARSYRP